MDRTLSEGGVGWTISTRHGHCPAPGEVASTSTDKVTRLSTRELQIEHV